MIVKVKEPQPGEWPLLRRGQIAVHLFPFRGRSRADRAPCSQSGATCVAYETLRRQARPAAAADADERSGRADEHPGGGQVPGDGRRWAAAFCWAACPAWRRRTSRFWAAAWSGRTPPRSPPASRPTSAILDINMDRLRYLDDIMPPNVNVLFSDRHTIREELRLADLVIGSVLIPGAKAPLPDRTRGLRLMKPGSVIIDVAIDQGGCVETSRPTTHSDPTYIVEDVVHYCVTNMPGAVGRTSTFALCNVTLPWALKIANRGVQQAARQFCPDRLGREHLPGAGDEPGGGGDVRTETLAAAVLREIVLKGADER